MDANAADATDARTSRTELALFAAVLFALEIAFYWDALRPGWVLSPSDWLLATRAFHTTGDPDFEPANRLLTDITCQMEPWLQLAAQEWHAGHVPLWNSFAGCGVPLLANAQSAPLSPFHLIYLITQSAYAWVAIALAKQLLAGIGTFLLARILGLGRRGRWFAGLVFPFSGFMVAWLQYPMGGVAACFPLILWLVERLARRPLASRAGILAIAIAGVLLGGHPETAAHILVVAGLYYLWRSWFVRTQLVRRIAWFSAAALGGFLLAAVQLVPIAEYLRASRVWTERSTKLPAAWDTQWPDLLAMPALAGPYIYGSYLRGHPHVEKAIGVENFNEIAGGYTGLTTIAVFVPIGLATRRYPWLRFWFLIDLVSIAAAYHFPVIDHVVRWIPILNITQNQRLLLVVALSHSLIGAAGVEAWDEFFHGAGRVLRRSMAATLGAGAIALSIAAIAVIVFGPAIHARALRYFEGQAELRGLDRDALREHAEMFAGQVAYFFPRYYGAIAAYAAILTVIVLSAARSVSWRRRLLVGLLLITLIDLSWFGRGINPAIPLRNYFPDCPVTDYLRHACDESKATGPSRVLVLDEEFPPNVLGRYGICDLRNYDAIELASQLQYFEPLWHDPGRRLTSNSWTTWDRIANSIDRLRSANARYLVSVSPPPAPISEIRLAFSSNRVGVYELDNPHFISFESSAAPDRAARVDWHVDRYEPGRICLTVEVRARGEGRLVIAECFMPGWRCSIDDHSVSVEPHSEVFLSVSIEPGEHRVELEYSPDSFRIGLALSAAGCLLCFALCCVPRGGVDESLPVPTSRNILLP